MFPGQSSLYPEMIERLIAADAANAACIDEASDVLGRDLRRHYAAGDPTIFGSNRDVQIGVFLANHLHWRMLCARDVAPVASLGMSLGEYNHLVEIGALEWTDALRLIARRGELYDEGPLGMMAAVGPIGIEKLEELLTSPGLNGLVRVSNYNAPTHHVIAGAAEDVQQALELLDSEHFVRGTIIERRLPMHTDMFSPVAHRLAPVLRAAPWKPVRRRHLPNVTGMFADSATPNELADRMSAHVHRPVLWRASIETILATHPNAVFVEVGPRSVLSNLLQRRWVQRPRFHTDDGDMQRTVDALAATLTGGLDVA